MVGVVVGTGTLMVIGVVGKLVLVVGGVVVVVGKLVVFEVVKFKVNSLGVIHFGILRINKGDTVSILIFNILYQRNEAITKKLSDQIKISFVKYVQPKLVTIYSHGKVNTLLWLGLLGLLLVLVH